MVAAAVVGSAVVGGAMASQAQGDAADSAAAASDRSTAASVGEQRRQFDAIQELLKPYVNAGTGALTGQQNLIGLNGGGAQQEAIRALEQSPQMQALVQQGENSILQNAAATGGLRGGKVQAALGQFRPALLSQLIESQFSKLGGLTSVGQNAAAMTGNAGMNSANQISGLLQQNGSVQANAAIANGQATANAWNMLPQAVGTYAGLGGFGKF